MKKIIYCIFTLLFFQNALYTQDTSAIKYLPLKVGNKWVYNRVTYFSPGPGKDVTKILSSFVNNNHRYYVLHNIMYLSNGTIYSNDTSVLRVDSINGNIYSWSTAGECLVDSLKSRVGDTVFSCIAWAPPEWFRCVDTNTYSIFGQNIKSKNFVMLNGFEASVDRRYGKNFGIVYRHSGAVMYHTYYYLQGCVLEGILYGDTTLVGISSISTEIPEEYSLSQNYPNPFNPVTKIKFSLPAVGQRHAFDVRLTVYDVLGREITVLVNEQLQPGTYEVEWDAAGGGTNYCSGIYFYRLETDEYTETKKMTLIK